MSLTKRWMEEQGLFDDDRIFGQITDAEYEYIKWLESQHPSSSSEDCSDVPESKDPS
jgi:hypothetical protein